VGEFRQIWREDLLGTSFSRGLLEVFCVCLLQMFCGVMNMHRTNQVELLLWKQFMGSEIVRKVYIIFPDELSCIWLSFGVL